MLLEVMRKNIWNTTQNTTENSFFVVKRSCFLAEQQKCRSKIFNNRTTQRPTKYIEETCDIFPSAQCIAGITFEVTTKPYPSKVRRVLMIAVNEAKYGRGM